MLYNSSWLLNFDVFHHPLLDKVVPIDGNDISIFGILFRQFKFVKNSQKFDLEIGSTVNMYTCATRITPLDRNCFEFIMMTLYVRMLTKNNINIPGDRNLRKRLAKYELTEQIFLKIHHLRDKLINYILNFGPLKLIIKLFVYVTI